MSRLHAFTDDALGELDTLGLVAALDARRVSASEAISAAVTRAERVAPTLGALCYVAYDRARAQARRPPPGFFAGVPTFVKDNADVAGMPTQHGSDAFLAAASRRDGDLARMLQATGLIPLGKTQLSEFGFSASAEHARLGAVRNPWHVEHTAGASSSGSAALVAAGVVPIAHANDGGGSIRIPASVNGLVGLKPTRDRLPQDRLLRDMPLRIVTEGVLTRSVRDTAAFLREAERVYRALRLPPVGDVSRPGHKRQRVALLTRSLGREPHPDVREQTLKTAALVEGLGHRVEEVAPPVPDSFPDDFLLYWSSLCFYLVRSGRLTFGATWDRGRIDNLSAGLAEHCRRNLPRLPGALRRLRRTARTSAVFYRHFDVVLSPTLAQPTPRLGHLDPAQDYETLMQRLMDWVAYTPYQNATGDPSISLPLARCPDGLPLGMMFSAGAGQEASLLGLALELEEALPFARIQD